MRLAKPTVDVGLVPHDVDAMTWFYADVLGLPPQPALSVGGTTVLRHAVGDATLKMLCVEPPPPREDGGIDAAIGYRLVTLIVSDLDDVLTRAEDAGVGEIERDTFDAGPMQVPLAFLPDPDGNRLEVVGVPGAPRSLQVGLTVGDVDRTMEFFTQSLELEADPPMTWNGIDRQSVQLGTTTVKFWQRGDDLPVRTGPMTQRAGIRYLTVTVDDVDETAARLRSRGVTMPLEPTDVGIAKVCIIADPDGNWIELAESRG
ncbi:MAG: VOC family protein [Acidimicrobiia bacterium]